MTGFLERIRALIKAGEVRISDHGYNELAEDRLTAREVVAGVQEAVVVEEYPNYAKGPSILLLQKDRVGAPIHVVWASRAAMTNLSSRSPLTDRTLSGGTKVF